MQPQKLRTFSWLIAAALMLGCAITAPATQTPQSLPPQDLSTIVAGTAGAAQTRTAIRITPSPTSTSTRTPSPTPTPATATPTFFFALPTFTPTITETLLPLPVGQGGGDSEAEAAATLRPRQGGLTTLEWACGIRERTFPQIRPKESFSIYVTLRNTGTKPWGINTIDFVYTGGYRHEGTKIMDAPANVTRGNTITFRVDFKAPKQPGTRNSFWTLKVGNHPFCGVKLSFEVIEK